VHGSILPRATARANGSLAAGSCLAIIDVSLRFYEALGFERRGRLQFEGAYNGYLGLPGAATSCNHRARVI
jgi:hypothetical protein